MSWEVSIYPWSYHHNQGLKLLFVLREDNSLASKEHDEHMKNVLSGKEHTQRELFPRQGVFCGTPQRPFLVRVLVGAEGAGVPTEPMGFSHSQGVICNTLICVAW